MDIDKSISLVDSEELYTHVLNVEGVKHPLDFPEKMEEVADYILAKFRDYGLIAKEHQFRVDGFDYDFRNVEGIISSGGGPELVIVSHYDTVAKSPGANDNGSAIAAMLECARILAESPLNGTTRFVSFCLEELNPTRLSSIRKMATRHGIRDSEQRILSWKDVKILKSFNKTLQSFLRAGFDYDKAIEETLQKLEDDLTPRQRFYFHEYNLLNKRITATNWPGKTGLIGSSAWVENAISEGRTVLGVICMDTIGYASNEKYSQKFPQEMDADMFDLYKVDEEIKIGNFITAIGDKNSELLTQSFRKQCKRNSIDLPYACLQEDFYYDQCAHFMHDLLRSDHAPFWRESIPGMFLTDTGNFRYIHYHTSADTIDKMDFDFLTKVTKAVLGTIVDIASNQ